MKHQFPLSQSHSLITSKKCFLFYNIDSKRKRKISYGTATQVNKSASGVLQRVTQ